MLWLGPFHSDRDASRQGRAESTHVHQQLTITVDDEMTRAARSWLRIHFRNNGDGPVTVTSATPFVSVSRAASNSPLLAGAAGHIWPESSAVSGDADEPRLVIKPGEVRSYSIAVHYPLEHLWASRDGAGADDPAQIDYCLRVETEDARGDRRMSSFRYMMRVVGQPVVGARGRHLAAPDRYPTLVLREA